MQQRGHRVRVLTSHPHYPGPLWGQRARPYRQTLNGVDVTRLPLWIGHRNAIARIREEATYAAALTLAALLRRRADVRVVVSPSFLALAPTVALTRLRREPWILWLQDILPDAAETTGLLRNGPALAAARALERRAYEAAARIVVISDTFRETLVAKGVPPEKIVRVYNPATRGTTAPRRTPGPPRLLYTGNIGFSQNLAAFTEAFVASPPGVTLVVTGRGEQEHAVRAIATRDVELLGLVDDDELERQLDRATIGLVTQRPDVVEFNVPSKLMTLMGRGIPILASVRAGSEVARIVADSGGGWVTPAERPGDAIELLRAVAADSGEIEAHGRAAQAFAQRHFAPEVAADAFERVIEEVVPG